MDEKHLQALASELAKNIKTPDVLSQFDRLLKKIGVGDSPDKIITRVTVPVRGHFQRNTVTAGTAPDS